MQSLKDLAFMVSEKKPTLKFKKNNFNTSIFLLEYARSSKRCNVHDLLLTATSTDTNSSTDTHQVEVTVKVADFGTCRAFGLCFVILCKNKSWKQF